MISIYNKIEKAIKDGDDYTITDKDLEPLMLENLNFIYINLIKKCINNITNKRINVIMTKIINEQFLVFINNNESIWNEIKMGQIIKIDEELTSLLHFTTISMLEYPFNVVYLGKQEGPEGPIYTFFNKDMDKVHEEYIPI